MARVAPTTRTRRNQAISVARHDVVVAVVAAVTGAIGGWAVPELVKHPADITLWALAFMSVLALITCLSTLGFVHGFKRVSSQNYAEMRGIASDIAAVVTQQARLIPRDRVYSEMAQCVREAKTQVVVMTFLMYDWAKGVRTFGPAVDGTPGREEFYDAIYSCIEKPDVEYVRVWQLPSDKHTEAETAINGDPLQSKELSLIRTVQRSHPESARYVIADQHTTASFVLVDERSLFVNIDYYVPSEGKWRSPYMLFIRDAGGTSFRDLRSIIVWLTSR